MDDLQSQDAIARLVLRYAQNIREGRGEACAALFADDAQYEIYMMNPVDPDSCVLRSRAEGRDAIIATIARPRPGMRICPLISNLLIDVTGTTATSSAMMRAHIFPSGEVTMGEYHDTFGYDVDAGWRFVARRYTIWSLPKGEEVPAMPGAAA